MQTIQNNMVFIQGTFTKQIKQISWLTGISTNEHLIHPQVVNTYWFEFIRVIWQFTEFCFFSSPNPLKRVEGFKTNHSLCSLLQGFANLTSLASADKLFVINMPSFSICGITLKQQLSGEKCRQNLHHKARHVLWQNAYLLNHLLLSTPTLYNHTVYTLQQEHVY